MRDANPEMLTASHSYVGKTIGKEGGECKAGGKIAERPEWIKQNEHFRTGWG